MAPVTQGNTGVSKSKRNNAKKRKNKKLGVGQMKLLAAISNSLPKLHDPSALPTEDDDSSASLKKYDAAGNIASMDWKKVTNYTLNQSARVRGSRYVVISPRVICAHTDSSHRIHRFYHDADLQTRAIPQMRTFQFLYHSDLPKEAKMLTLILSTDPYVTVDRSHINCRYHLLRVLLKKLHGEKLLKWEYWFLRACIEHRYVSGNSMLNSFVEYLEKCPVHQRPTRLTKPQREKWRSLEVAVSIAWGNKTYQVSGGIDMALLRAGMDLLFPKIYYQEDLEKDFDAEDSWLPVQIYRAQVGQSGIPLGPEARDDEVDYVIRDFVSEGMMDGGRGVKIDSRGMTDLVGQLGAKPERDELEGEDDVNSETVLDNLSTLILNMENTSLILKAAYPTVFNFHTKVCIESSELHRI